MSNDLNKILDMPRPAREVDLLSDFYEQWFMLHKMRHERAERADLESQAQALLEAHVAIETFRKRHAKH
jgi:transposase-like protein